MFVKTKPCTLTNAYGEGRALDKRTVAYLANNSHGVPSLFNHIQPFFVHCNHFYAYAGYSHTYVTVIIRFV